MTHIYPTLQISNFDAPRKGSVPYIGFNPELFEDTNTDTLRTNQNPISRSNSSCFLMPNIPIRESSSCTCICTPQENVRIERETNVNSVPKGSRMRLSTEETCYNNSSSEEISNIPRGSSFSNPREYNRRPQAEKRKIATDKSPSDNNQNQRPRSPMCMAKSKFTRFGKQFVKNRK